MLEKSLAKTFWRKHEEKQSLDKDSNMKPIVEEEIPRHVNLRIVWRVYSRSFKKKNITNCSSYNQDQLVIKTRKNDLKHLSSIMLTVPTREFNGTNDKMLFSLPWNFLTSQCQEHNLCQQKRLFIYCMHRMHSITCLKW